MARRKQEGNRFFRLDVDFFSDKKVKILKARYGADGVTLYLYILCEIYKAGYYLKIDEDFEFIVSDDLSMDSNKVKQVLNFLLERSLFDNTLFQSDKDLTSAGIQRRYQAMVKARALKNPITVEGFWLLSEEETETFIKVNPSLNNSENNPDNSRKNEDNSEKNDTKGKEKKGEYIYTAPPGTYFEDSSLNDAFLLFLKVRQNNGDSLTKEQVQLLREELLSMSDKPEELTAIVKKSAMNGWKSFYPLKKARTRKTEAKGSKNRFNNFPQREYDFEEYEKQLLKKSQEGQNYGAGKKDRIKSGYHISIRLLICWAALITIAFVFFPRQISVLFFHEEEVIRLSVDYLRIIGFSEIFLSVEMMTVGALSGLGRTQLCSLISVGLTVIRIPLALVLSNTALGLNGIWWALTLSTVSKGIIFYFVFQYICEHSLLRTTNR